MHVRVTTYFSKLNYNPLIGSPAKVHNTQIQTSGSEKYAWVGKTANRSNRVICVFAKKLLSGFIRITVVLMLYTKPIPYNKDSFL